MLDTQNRFDGPAEGSVPSPKIVIHASGVAMGKGSL